MRRSQRGYSGYRGRRTVNDLLKFIAIVLAVLVGLLLVGLFIGQDYIVVTDNGLRLDVPFFRREEPVREPDPGSINVVVQPSGSGQEEAGESSASPEAAEEPLRAAELPLSAVVDGTAAQRLEELGANALILTMKDREGKLGWTSGQSLALQAEVNSELEGINEALQQWNREDIYTVALVCCFRDNTVPYHNNQVALRADYGNWRDELGLRWLDPDNGAAQDYLVGLCGELAELGFDEILLDCCAFPDKGRLEAILPNGTHGGTDQDRADAVEAFLKKAGQAVRERGAELSVLTDRTRLEESGTSGLSSQVLEAYACRIWMSEDDGQPTLVQALSQAGVTDAENRLVAIAAALEKNVPWGSAVMDGK